MSAHEDMLIWQCRAAKLPEPVPQHRFAQHIGRRWRFDLAWPAQKVACEVDGAIWTRGRHARGSGIIADCEKVSTAAAMGWRVLRVAPEHVKSGQALAWIEGALSDG